MLFKFVKFYNDNISISNISNRGFLKAVEDLRGKAKNPPSRVSADLNRALINVHYTGNFKTNLLIKLRLFKLMLEARLWNT